MSAPTCTCHWYGDRACSIHGKPWQKTLAEATSREPDLVGRGPAESFGKTSPVEIDDSSGSPDVAALVEALREARPYVYNRTTGANTWREQTARDVLSRVDAALRHYDATREVER